MDIGGCEYVDDWYVVVFFFFFKQKTAYEIVSRDWSSDVCSSDLRVVWSESLQWDTGVFF